MSTPEPIQQPFQRSAIARVLRSPALVTGLLLVTIPVIVVTVVMSPGPQVSYWTPATIRDLVVWNAAVAAAAFVFSRLISRWASHAVVGSLALYLLGGIGLAQGLAALMFVASAYAAGRFVIGHVLRTDSDRPLVANSLAIGVTIYLALFGVLVHFHVNFRSTYVVILALPLVAAAVLLASSNRSVAAHFEAITRWSTWLAGRPLVLVTVVVAVIGYVARAAFFPSVGYDDIMAHLRMWTVLSTQGIFSFDPVESIWSVAPFALDLLSAVISIVAGADSRGAISLTLLVLLLGQLWELSAYVVSSAVDRAILLMLFASTPMVANLLTLQHVELLLALLATAGVLLTVKRRRRDAPGRTAAVFGLAALCAATKLPGAILGAAILAAYFLRVGSRREDRSALLKSMPGLLFLLPVLALAALHSYAIAWKTTGNPVFPLYNGYFKSPLAPPTNFTDLRWVTGFTLSSYWDVFFGTRRHFESSSNFTGGFQYLLVLPLGLVLLVSKKFRAVRWPLLLPLLGYGLAMFKATQYWRYLFPVLPLASVAVGATLSGLPGVGSPLHPALRRAVLLCLTAINLFFLPGVSYFFWVPAYRYYTEAGKEAVAEGYAPGKALTEEASRRFPGARVLLASEPPTGATLVGTPIVTTWHSPSREARANSWRTAADVAEFINSERIDLVIWDQGPMITRDPRGVLNEYLSHHGHPERAIGSAVLYRILDHEPSYRTVFSGAATANQEPQVIGKVDFGRASVARYSVTFRCPSEAGRFIAQINWEGGPPYYRAVQCSGEPVQFSETVPIPLHARTGDVYVTVQETREAIVSSLKVETN